MSLSKLHTNKLPPKNAFSNGKNIEGENWNFLKYFMYSLEDDIMFLITSKNSLFNSPFTARLQDLVGRHFAIEKLVGSFHCPTAPSVTC